MKAAYINKTGSADEIIYGELPLPTLASKQCLIRIAAVAVNPIDTYVRSGAVQMSIPYPFVLGSDFAGIVAEVGSEVTRYRVGDRVWGSNQGLLGRQGTFSEFAAIDEAWLYPSPPGVADESLAALALVGITAHLGLFREAKLRPGDILFVTGGSGGVGSAVVQLAKAAGARVITTAGDELKASKCRELGADEVILYRSEDLERRVRELATEGVDVWWETLREPNFDRMVGLLRRRGRMVIMAGREARPAFPVGPFYVKGCSLYGFVMFAAAPDEQDLAARDLIRWILEGKLRANIDKVLPLSETSTAHQLQESSTLNKSGVLAGKLVLKP